VTYPVTVHLAYSAQMAVRSTCDTSGNCALSILCTVGSNEHL